ncbi:nitronate monooxygenase [Neobacillus cucumis]|uniref:NAD(P)H-dependent flavin oxidoreductase n=1 Tax=Neobacillus cucumis TaxID=1740721 RepID=UPI0018DFEA0E|nr:nitronate monooxygenase family protein [Neobacillus cucumis]MBI0579211.1 nitronate monooxygenase [Neobacillus cucumis]
MGNRICELLDVKYPIIEGGMAYVGNGALAAAVSNGGGFGQVGSAGRSPENFEEEILLASQLTKSPFGVNLPISEHKDNQPYIDVIAKHKDKIKAVSISAGNPSPFIPIFKEMGLVVMVITATAKHALKAEKSGADIIVCEGYEAGGHNGGAELTTFSLVPHVSRIVGVPVVAAGGIMDGHGMVAAMTLGADGVQMGTRFVATKECQAHENYKQYLVDSSDDATTILTRKIGGVIRVLKSDYAFKVQKIDQETSSIEEILPYVRGSINKKAVIEGDFDNGWASAGQGVSLINEIISAEDVVRNIVEEANNVITNLKKIDVLTRCSN